MKPRPSDLQRLLSDPPPSLRAALFFGPAEGLVRERAETLARAIVEDLGDPFRVCSLGADQIASDPARLVDEAAALSMLGGRRLVRVRGAGDALLAPFESLLASETAEALVVVEAGDLGTRAKLVKLFEGDERAAAIACYEEASEAIEDFVASLLRAANLPHDAGFVHELCARLPGDRRLIRGELDKLALFAHGEVNPDRAALIALVTPAEEMDLDALTDAVADGNLASADRALTELFEGGSAPVQILRILSNYLTRIEAELTGLSAGPGRPLPFHRKAALARQANRWTRESLSEAQARLIALERAVKRTGAPDELLTSRTVLTIAALARGRN
ncbi:MAG: DNA polymerase III subunit delta [Alphaproteobacteria bacterium]|nr:DNA polymerase III subunit delta [Alphaproteobacteria bacterium]